MLQPNSAWLLEQFKNELLQYHGEEIENILLKEDSSIHYSVEVDVQLLLEHNQEAGNILFQNPNDVLPVFGEAICAAQQRILSDHELCAKMAPKPFVHVRLINLPAIPELLRTRISTIRSNDARHLISLCGTVVRTGAAKMLEAEREYECKQCHHRFRVSSVLENNSVLELPKKCPNPQRNGRGKNCKSTTFQVVDGSRVCRDYQEIRVQEQVQKMDIGCIPRSLPVVLQDDLVDSIQAGDDVTVTGIVRRLWRPVARDQRCDLDLFVEANSVQVHNDKHASVTLIRDTVRRFHDFWEQHKEEPLRGREILVRSVCPQLFGLFLVKLSVLLTLIGGVPRHEKKMRVRGESHLMLVGDPGTGKSQLLRFASKLVARSVLTTGIGTTRAGLTVTATKDNGEWVLEAGALVLADGGLCCIDEFGCVRESDRATIHEAMEQQTLSIAKAGLVCTLNTRTTVFACLNPKGVYDEEVDLSVNCAIASPLLSRFDLIMLMLDKQDDEWDERVVSHILQTLHPGQQEEEAQTRNLWGVEDLKAYVHFVKSSLNPRITPLSEKVLITYYQRQRMADQRSQARTTIRLLESLIRLAQAHARLMFREEVLLEDAVTAVLVMEASMQNSALNTAAMMQRDMKTDPTAAFKEQERELLASLGLKRQQLDSFSFQQQSAQ